MAGSRVDEHIVGVDGLLPLGLEILEQQIAVALFV